MENALLKIINEWRRGQGKPPLEWNKKLHEMAYHYSQDMSERQFFSHIDPDGRTVEERLRASGIPFIAVGENLAKATNGSVVPSRLLEAWVRSPSHRKNLLESRFTKTGIGVFMDSLDTYYVTQIFVQPLSTLRTGRRSSSGRYP
jgi:uncharacterized protein YkwD